MSLTTASIVAFRPLRCSGRKRVPVEMGETRIIALRAFLPPPVPCEYENPDERIADDIQRQIRRWKDNIQSLQILRHLIRDAHIKVLALTLH